MLFLWFFVFIILFGIQMEIVEKIFHLSPGDPTQHKFGFIYIIISGVATFYLRRAWKRRRTKKETTSEDKPIKPKSLSSKEKIEFWYSDADENVTYRTVSVIKLTTQYLEGYCHLRKDMRTFRISRIDNEIIDCSTGEIFSKDDWLANHGIQKITTYRKTSDVN